MDVSSVFDFSDDVVQKLISYPDRNWTVVRALSHKVKSSASSCSAQGIVIYNPLIFKADTRHRGKRVFQVPMFSTYFFAAPTPEERVVIRRTQGVLDLIPVKSTEEPLFLGDLLRVRESELLSLHHQVLLNPGLHVGDTVRIKRGPFKNQEVTVTRREGTAKVIVNLFFFGQNIQLTCLADELEY